MDITALLTGVVIGFSIAAPVGPIGVLCIQRTLANGRLSGLISGLGAATADGLFGAVAAFGLTAFYDILIGQQFWLRLIGGLFLLYLGIRTMLSRPPEKTTAAKKGNLLVDYFSTLGLTAANPLTILSFAAIFTGLSALDSGTPSALMLALGVFLGSAFWWTILSIGVSIVRSHFNAAALLITNRVSGFVIMGFALYLLIGNY
jgi:threonine/homoserine/homoserine lactone efflux protein